MRHRRLAVPFLLAAIALAVSACDATPKAGAGTPAAPPSPAASSALASPAAAAVIVTETSQVKDGLLFRTPSGNIGCGAFPDSVRCSILTKTWTPPPPPADCDLDWGTNIELDPKTGANLICAGDSTLSADAKAIAYGHAIRIGSIVCTSTQVNLRCEHLTTKHGFTLAKENYTTF